LVVHGGTDEQGMAQVLNMFNLELNMELPLQQHHKQTHCHSWFLGLGHHLNCWKDQCLQNCLKKVQDNELK
jgi:hypothetical protein